MRMFMTGATGFIGTALFTHLRGEGHEIIAWVRDERQAAAALGREAELVSTRCSDETLAQALAGCDAVVNLAGSPAVRRWTKRRKTAIWSSRVDLTRRLVDAMQRLDRPPSVFVSTSAIGYYDDAGDTVVEVTTPPGRGFLAELAVAWEREAMKAERFGVRVVCIRLGVVLGRSGGPLGPATAWFRMGLGAQLSDGRAWMPWIHLDDAVRLYAHCLAHDELHGVLEGAAPNPVRNADFTAALARTFGRAAPWRLPLTALRLALGEAHLAVTASIRLLPARVLSFGFRFRFSTLENALADIFDDRGVSIGVARGAPESQYLNDRGASYMLSAEQSVPGSLAEVRSFFQHPENLGLLTPPQLGFDIRTRLPTAMHAGLTIDYHVSMRGVPMRWRTQIAEFDPKTGRFVDLQLRGPYRSWYHVHEFEEAGGRTIIRDRVFYRPPFGWLGRLAHALFIRRQLTDIFAHRARVVDSRFSRRTGSPMRVEAPMEVGG
ncbi:MAG: TIGR01777 family protein [Myxococcales bacterium FL481]|nr:MAG: TIGR01777 family protein [Myxococcales bacterium FL481]